MGNTFNVIEKITRYNDSPSTKKVIIDFSYSTKQLSLLESLADEILLLVFEYVFCGGFEQINHLPYRVLSKRLIGPVTEAGKKVYQKQIQSIRGVIPTSLYKLPQSFKQCLPPYLHRDGVDHEYQIVEITIHCDLNLNTVGLLYEPPGQYSQIMFRAFKNMAFLAPESRKKVLSLTDHYTTLRMDSVIWNYPFLIIQYPLTNYHPYLRDSEAGYMQQSIVLCRKYYNSKGFFTLDDLVNRVETFYRTGFSTAEWDHVTGQLQNEFNRRKSKGDLDFTRNFEDGGEIHNVQEFCKRALYNSDKPFEEFLVGLENGTIQKMDTMHEDRPKRYIIPYLFRPNNHPDKIIMGLNLPTREIISTRGHKRRPTSINFTSE